MTLAAGTGRMPNYVGTGLNTVFPYTFKILAATDLVVTKRDTLNVETTLILNTNYTVSGVDEDLGGNVTLTVALPLNNLLTIVRVRPLSQATDIKNQGEFFPEIHEDALDHLTMISQQHQEQISRVMQLPITVDPAVVNPDLPIPSAGKAFRWNSAGTALENYSVATVGPTVVLPVAAGLVAHEGGNVFSARTLTAGAGVAVANGDGVAGNPTVSIPALGVVNSMLAADAVTTAKILDANVTTAKILDANVTTAKIADANVTTAKILDANVTPAKLAADAVTTVKILDANVTTAKIADSAVTSAKIAQGVAVKTQFIQTAPVTVANSVAELTILGAGAGTLVLPTNFFNAGKLMKVILRCRVANVSGMLALRLRLNATQHWTVTLDPATAMGSLNGDLNVTIYVTGRTAGAGGTLFAKGCAERVVSTFAVGGTVTGNADSNVATSAIDTTIAQTLDVTGQWTIANAGNTITTEIAVVEFMN